MSTAEPSKAAADFRRATISRYGRKVTIHHLSDLAVFSESDDDDGADAPEARSGSHSNPSIGSQSIALANARFRLQQTEGSSPNQNHSRRKASCAEAHDFASAAKLVHTHVYGTSSKGVIGNLARKCAHLGGRKRAWDEILWSYLRFTPAVLHRELDLLDLEGGLPENMRIVNSYTMALLLIDISGFTKMSVRLGAERTRKHTSKFFGKIIARIVAEEGDVLKFLGDAMLVCWPCLPDGSDAEKSNLAISAVRTAAEVMHSLNGYYIEEGDITLCMHGGLAIGSVHSYDVGSSHRREFLIGGSVLAELGAAESDAGSGEIVMTSAFAALLPSHLKVEKLASGNLKLGGIHVAGYADDICSTYDRLTSRQLSLQFCADDDSPEIDFMRDLQQCLMAHVPLGCCGFVDDDMLENLGEMRHVTTLFINLDALMPYLNSGDVDRVQQAFLVILEAVSFTGGELRQFVFDDKGVVAICAWGLPHAAHGPGNDAVRALQCGFILLEGYRHLKWPTGVMEPGPHIGIAAGEVYVGLLGSQLRCEYAMVGPSVNLSARLMGKAPEWSILVEEQVHGRFFEKPDHMILCNERRRVLPARLAVDFKPHKPIKAKGYDQLIAVFRPECLNMTIFKESTVLGNCADSFIEHWDMFAIDVQFVAKVASVLAVGPPPHDFRYHALADVTSVLSTCSYNSIRSAVVMLKACRILYLTRGARREEPSYAFHKTKDQAWILKLFTVEYILKVHKSYARWLKEWLDTVDNECMSDVVAQQARRTLIHKELDPKLEYHRKKSMEMVPTAVFTFRQWFRELLHCCTIRGSESQNVDRGLSSTDNVNSVRSSTDRAFSFTSKNSATSTDRAFTAATTLPGKHCGRGHADVKKTFKGTLVNSVN